MNKLSMNKRNKNNWKKGDTFYLKISKSEHKEFIGKYLIFIVAEEKEKWQLGPAFRVKITSYETIPQSYEEIEKLEYIITWVDILEQSKRFPDRNPNKVLIPDEYGYIYLYQIEIRTTNRNYKIPEEFTYIGNFDFPLPDNEYLPQDRYIWSFDLWKEIDKILTKYYYDYNLKNWGSFDKKIAQQWRGEKVAVYQMFDAIQKADHEGTLKFIEEKPKKRSTLTYVGGDLNHPDYKRGCKNRNTKKQS